MCDEAGPRSRGGCPFAVPCAVRGEVSSPCPSGVSHVSRLHSGLPLPHSAAGRKLIPIACSQAATHLPPRRMWGFEEGASRTGAYGNLPHVRPQLVMPSFCSLCGVLAARAWTRGRRTAVDVAPPYPPSFRTFLSSKEGEAHTVGIFQSVHGMMQGPVRRQTHGCLNRGMQWGPRTSHKGGPC